VNIAIAANRGWALLNSRRLLIDRLLAAGFHVTLITTDDLHARELEQRGATLAPVQFARGSLSPRSDLRAGGRMRGIYSNIRPVIAHHFHAKPMMLGSLAAPPSVGHIVNTVTGLGSSLPDAGPRRWVAQRLYASATRRASMTVFQNVDDQRLFEEAGLLDGQEHTIIESSGVDIGRFVPWEGCRSERRVLMMSRLLHQKGVAEFIAAARAVRRNFDSDVSFELAGEWDLEHPDAIQPSELEAMNADDAVTFIGFCNDPAEWLPGASAFVCPSSYREGVPRVILEAAACGVPVIGSDAPGIRDSILDGTTGFHVPARDAAAITESVQRLLSDYELRRKMRGASRDLAVERFDIEGVTDRYLALYAELGVEVD
jgi:glycosyltransferase involved in cell wall biosynthesis